MPSLVHKLTSQEGTKIVLTAFNSVTGSLGAHPTEARLVLNTPYNQLPQLGVGIFFTLAGQRLRVFSDDNCEEIESQLDNIWAASVAEAHNYWNIKNVGVPFPTSAFKDRPAGTNCNDTLSHWINHTVLCWGG